MIENNYDGEIPEYIEKSGRGCRAFSYERGRVPRPVPLFLLLFLSCAFFLSACSSKVSELRLSGIDFLEKGKYEDAIDCFSEALKESKGKVSAEQFDILCYRAEAEYMLGDYDKARDTLDMLLELDGEKESYARLLSQIEAKFLVRDATDALNEGDLEAARAKLDEAREAGLVNDRDLLYDEAVYLEKTAQWEAAYASFTEYLGQYPGDPEAERELMFLETRVEALRENTYLSAPAAAVSNVTGEEASVSSDGASAVSATSPESDGAAQD